MLFSDNEVNSMFSFVCCSCFVRSLAGLLSYVKNKTKAVIYWSSTGHFLRLTIIILYYNISRGILYSIRSSIPQISSLLLLYAMVIYNFGELETKYQQQPDDLQLPGQKDI